MPAKAWRLALLIIVLPLILSSCTIPFKEKFLQIKEKNNPDFNKIQNSQNTFDSETTDGKEIEKLFKVVRVIDGDTFELESGQKVRMIGIDAPEKVDCFSKKSAERLSNIVLSKLVKLERDVSETDRFGRLLRNVYLEGVFINELMVKEGYASSYSYPPDITLQEKIVSAQKYSQENNLGLWAECKSRGQVQPVQAEVKGFKEVAQEPNRASSDSSKANSSNSVLDSTNTNVAATAPQTTSPLQDSTNEQASFSNNSELTTETVSHVYYTSSHYRSKYYYCDTDSGWKSLSKNNLRSFNSIEELLKEFPNRKPHKDPVC